MIALTPGCLCLCRQCGKQLFVAVRQTDEYHWHLRGKLVDRNGRAAFQGRTAGIGDITVVREADTYVPGTEIEHDGVKHTVARDLGDSVELVTPEVSRPLRGGGALRKAAGNTVTMAKSDLAVGADAITTDLMIT